MSALIHPEGNLGVPPAEARRIALALAVLADQAGGEICISAEALAAFPRVGLLAVAQDGEELVVRWTPLKAKRA